MKIAVLNERDPQEARVAAHPDAVKKWVAQGFEVAIERGAGERSSLSDAQFVAAGAKIALSLAEACQGATVVLKVNAPTDEEIRAIPSGAVLVGILNPYDTADKLRTYAASGITAFAMELMPRITKAQSMDVLSSQSNLAGYKAVIDAAAQARAAFPLMMTAAGTVAPAQVLVIGAGVAGLQAIATAKRMGAVVSVFDVRRETKEQVQSLGGTFIEVESGEEGSGQGGYAKEMSQDYQARQSAKMHEVLKKMDIVITTALIPGRPAPKLITAAMVGDMKPGAILVDLAAPRGGNCELTEAGKVVVKNGIEIIGHTNYPSRMAINASQLYARNLLNFLALLINAETKSPNINLEEKIIKDTLLTHQGKIVHEMFAPKQAA